MIAEPRVSADDLAAERGVAKDSAHPRTKNDACPALVERPPGYRGARERATVEVAACCLPTEPKDPEDARA